METNLCESHLVIEGKQQLLDDLMSGMDILYQYAAEAIDVAYSTGGVAGRLMTACYMFRRLLLIMIMMFIVVMGIRV